MNDPILRPLQWLLRAPPRYEALACLAGLLPLTLALIAVARDGSSPRRPDFIPFRNWIFPFSLFLTLFAFRWPAFFHYPELNPDEALAISGANTLRYDPVYWRSFDGTTHGPLDELALLLPRLFGWPVNFATARVMGVALVAGALACFWAGARRLWGEGVARLSVLPPLAFFAFSTYWDFVHYTSEHVSLFLLAAAFAFIVSAFSQPPPIRFGSAWRWAAAGIALGAIPFAKMQAGPPAAGLLIIGVVAAGKAGPPDGRCRRRALAALGFGVFLPAAGCLLHLWVHHLWSPFWQCYVVNNLRYATETKMFSIRAMLIGLPGFAAAGEGVVPYALGGGAFILLALGCAFQFGRREWRDTAVAAILAALSLYAIVAPGRKYYHYLLLGILPLAGLGGALLAAVLRPPSKPDAIRHARRWKLITAFLVFGLGPQTIAKIQRPNPFLGDLASYPGRPSPVAVEVLRHARPGEPLAVWGYMARYYVETGLPQASRDANSERQLLPHPQLAYYRDFYLSDLRRHRPPVFLDAVGPEAIWPHDRSRFGHEIWPELRDWVGRNYRQIADIEGVRIYVRVDRLPPR